MDETPTRVLMSNRDVEAIAAHVRATMFREPPPFRFVWGVVWRACLALVTLAAAVMIGAAIIATLAAGRAMAPW